jgi:hypothetical protein
MRAFFFWLVEETSIFAWIVTIALDLFWNLLESLSLFSGIGVLCYPVVMIAIFTLCFATVSFIQHFLSGDEWQPAMAKGTVFGLIAATPFSVISLIAGMIGLIVRQAAGRDYTFYFGKFGLNYRELEKTIKRAAVRTGRLNGNWGEVTMETAINTLEQAQKISPQEAQELHDLRIARNQAHHEKTPADLMRWVNLSEQILHKFQHRFGMAV